jgi:hypothetical protein
MTLRTALATAASTPARPAPEGTHLDLLTGTLTHQTIAAVLRRLNAEGSHDVAMLILTEGSRVVAASAVSGSQRARTRMRVATAAGQYIQRYQPGPPSVYLGSEIAAGDGRVDLVWNHPRIGVFYDEVKTTRHHSVMSPTDLAQVTRYARAGHTQYGDRFAGVRYLPLLNMSTAMLATVDDDDRITVTSLAGSPLALGFSTLGATA